MKKGDIVQGYVERVDFPNKGIVRIVEEDRNVVVKNTIPGQKLEVQINKLRKGKAEGRVVSVLENSPIETENACPHFGACGGCVYQSVDYKEQLKIKEVQIKGLLDSVIDYDYYLYLKSHTNADGTINKDSESDDTKKDDTSKTDDKKTGTE